MRISEIRSPDERHWHGAAPTTIMTHIATVDKTDENSTEWMEKVSDEQYRAETRPNKRRCANANMDER